MSESIMSGGASILPCPKCGEMIYSDATTCRFCSAAIDPLAAEAGAKFQKQIRAGFRHSRLPDFLAGKIRFAENAGQGFPRCKA